VPAKKKTTTPAVFVERVLPVTPGPAMRVRLFAPRKLRTGEYECIAQITDGTEVLLEKPLFGVDSLQALRIAAGIAHLMIKLRLVNRGAVADPQMLEDLALFELTLAEPPPRTAKPVELAYPSGAARSRARTTRRRG
jgi:hypothetical protein